MDGVSWENESSFSSARESDCRNCRQQNKTVILEVTGNVARYKGQI